VIVLVGAGLAGLSTAYHLHKIHPGNEFLIFERSPVPGGLCRTEKTDGFLFDYTGHLLHLRKPASLALLRKIATAKLVRHRRRASIYTLGTVIPYPFQVNLHGLPPAVVRQCVNGFIEVYNHRQRRDNFANWTEDTFGHGITRCFMKPYNTKVWRVPLEELSCEWVGRYVPQPDIDEVIAGALGATKTGIGYNAQFYYPQVGGIQSLVDGFVNPVGNSGVLKTGVEVLRVNNKKKVVLLRDATGVHSVKYDVLISTIPLVELVKRIEDVPDSVRQAARRLRWNSVINVNFGFRGSPPGNWHWLYVPEKKYRFYRVGFPGALSSSMVPRGTYSVSTEVSQAPVGMSRKRLHGFEDSVLRDLYKCGFAKRDAEPIVQKTLVLDYGYVLYDHHWKRSRRVILDWLKHTGIISIGRYGRWEYSTMEDAILQGREAAASAARNVAKY